MINQIDFLVILIEGLCDIHTNSMILLSFNLIHLRVSIIFHHDEAARMENKETFFLKALRVYPWSNAAALLYL